MTRVATYVFLDLETTGLPKHELNKTRITELSMVVVRRRHILDTRPGAAPRVLENLTLCFNPGRVIHPDSSDVSGLDNFLLEHHTPFNMNVFNTINSFLQCFEKPVCLVAQNGHSFDFPILKNHFEKLGVSLSDDILCADSLHAMYDIFGLGWGQKNTDNVDASVNDQNLNESSGGQQLHNQTSDKIVEEQHEGIRSDKQVYNNSSSHLDTHITNELLKDFEKNNDLNNQQLLQQQNERTPVQKQRVPVPKPIKAIDKVKRRLFYKKTGKEPGKSPSVSYKMKNLYERELQRPAIDAHRAENDCVMSMEVAVSVAKKFVDWVDNADNQCKFSEVNPMKLGVPLGD